MSYTSNGRREKQTPNLQRRCMDGESKIFTNVVKKWARTPLSRAKNSKNKWAEWLGRGEREGDKGGKEFCPGWRHQPGPKAPLLSRLVAPTGTKVWPFVPVGATNRDKRPPFCPGWCLQPGQNSLAPLSPYISPRPSHSAHLFLLFLARERGVLARFFTTFVNIFDSPSIHRH